MDKYLVPRALLKTDTERPTEKKSQQRQVTIESLSVTMFVIFELCIQSLTIS